jgi:hypothetical protein
MRIGDFKAFSEYCTRLILHEQKAAMRFVASNLLHDVKVIDGGEEVAEGEDGYGLFGQRSRGIAELIDLRAGRTVKYTRDGLFRGESSNAAAAGIQIGTMTGDGGRNGFILTLSVTVIRLLGLHRVVRVTAAEMEETIVFQSLAIFSMNGSTTSTYARSSRSFFCATA